MNPNSYTTISPAQHMMLGNMLVNKLMKVLDDRVMGALENQD